MKHLYRMIIWGTVLILCILSAIFGIVIKNKMINNYSDELDIIVRGFNINELFDRYRALGIELYARVEGKDIIVTYDKKEYKYELHNGYLQTKYETVDTVAENILTGIAIETNKYLNNYHDINSLFANKTIYSYTLDKGIEFTNKNNYIVVKLSLDKAISTTNL